MVIKSFIRQMMVVGVFLCFGAGSALAQGTAIETLGFTIEIESAFFMQADTDSGNIEITAKMPGNASDPEHLRVQVFSNVGRPYKIVQKLDRKLSGDAGVHLGKEELRFVVTDGQKGGRSKVRTHKPVWRKPEIVFESNRKGDGDSFTISYFTLGKKVLPAGDYIGSLKLEAEWR